MRVADATQFGERGAIVGQVLQHVQARDQVESVVGERQRLERADASLGAAARARRLHRRRAGVDADDVPVAREVLHHPPRSAARVEHVAVFAEREPVEHGAQHAPAAPIPPVPVVGLEHAAQLRVLHAYIPNTSQTGANTALLSIGARVCSNHRRSLR